jgi:mannose-1-phosphate guanylyltransferase
MPDPMPVAGNQTVPRQRTKDQVVEQVYNRLNGQSIDYGVMENASQVLVVEGDFGWSDLGGWEENL